MQGTSNTIRRVNPSAGAFYAVRVDVDHVVLHPGDVAGVWVQAVDRAGNGVAVEGMTIGLEIWGDGAAYASLGSTSLVADVGGGATTTLTIDGDCPLDVDITVSWVPA